MRLTKITAVLFLASLSQSVFGVAEMEELLPVPNDIRAILDARCVMCHGEVIDGRREIREDIDLSSDSAIKRTVDDWETLRDVIEFDEMPDENAKLSSRLRARNEHQERFKRLKQEYNSDPSEKEALLAWLNGELEVKTVAKDFEYKEIKAKVMERLSESDRQTFTQYVEGTVKERKYIMDRQGLLDQRSFISDADVLAVIKQDWGDGIDPIGFRYLTLANLYNSGASEQQLATTRNAVAKVLNSLSWGRKLSRPTELAVNGVPGVLLRVRLDDYQHLGGEWDYRWWWEIEAEYPYGRDYDGSYSRAVAGALSDLKRGIGDEATIADLQELLAKSENAKSGIAVYVNPRVETQGFHPFLRADWFVFRATQPETYHRMLMLPESRQELENYLGINVVENIRNGVAIRSGTSRSGVSSQNRLVEFHPIPDSDRQYWLSYDFFPINSPTVGESKARDLFEFPLGPAEAEISASRAFDHGGGEVIFTLPNGMHGYYLALENGRRIDEGPTEIVTATGFHRDSIVVNGVSCMACHNLGTKPIVDSVLSYYEATKSDMGLTHSEARYIEKLYNGGRVTELLSSEAVRYKKALTELGIESGADPIWEVVYNFDQKIYSKDGPSELGMSQQQFDSAIQASLFSSDLRSLRNLFLKGLNREDFLEQVGNLEITPSFIPTKLIDINVLDRVKRPWIKGISFDGKILGLGSGQVKLIWVEPGRVSDRNGSTYNASQGFWMSSDEVGSYDYKRLSRAKIGEMEDEDLVLSASVTWEEAISFCEDMNKKYRDDLPEGYKFTLPTASQWEYAYWKGAKDRITLEYLSDCGDSLKLFSGISRNKLRIDKMDGGSTEWCLDGRGTQRFVRGTSFIDLAFHEERIQEIHDQKNFTKPHPSSLSELLSKRRKDKFLGFRIVLAPK